MTTVDTADVGSSGRDPRTRRWPCPWCASAEAWPDGCSESIDAPIDAPPDGLDVRCCVAMIERQCGAGDHRRCRVGGCTVAARWHDPVRQAGVAAAIEAGHAFAVVSTISNDVEVVTTTDHLNHAKLMLRNALSAADDWAARRARDWSTSSAPTTAGSCSSHPVPGRCRSSSLPSRICTRREAGTESGSM